MYPIILAIDFGTKRVGVAISRGTLAEPLQIIPHDDQLFAELLKIIECELVSEIIVGLSENHMADLTREFVDELRKHSQIPISFVDETLSSHTVHQKTLQGGMPQSQRRQPVDHLAAAEFLQEHLDSQKMVYSDGA